MSAGEGNQNAKGNKGGGRKSKYRPEYAVIAKKHCELGATDADLAAAFEVTEPTINAWKIAHLEFSLALKTAKAPADDTVERRLYQRATGYVIESEKVFQFQGKVVRAKTREHIAPDTTACIFWLKNRRPELWRDKHEVEHSGSIGLADRLAAALASVEEDAERSPTEH